MNTLTIPQKQVTTIASTTINLPYYAMAESFGGQDYFAIVSDGLNNLQVTLYPGNDGFMISRFSPSDLPSNAVQCSKEAFTQAYEKAQLLITDKFLESTGQSIDTDLAVSQHEDDNNREEAAANLRYDAEGELSIIERQLVEPPAYDTLLSQSVHLAKSVG